MTSPLFIKIARAIEVAPDKWNASPDLQSQYPLQEYIAHEAVMALREPTEGMVKAGEAECYEWTSDGHERQLAFRDGWEAAIYHALAEDTKP